MRIGLRPSVAVREHSIAGALVLYLSLYDDEIDERWSRFGSGGGDLEAAAGRLELTDAALIVRGDEVVAMRGGACTFPLFWHASAGGLCLTTRLPVAGGVPFSRAGLVAGAAAAALHSSYEPNAFLETPLAGWFRLRRGALTRFRAARVLAEQPIVGPVMPGAEPGLEAGVSAKAEAGAARDTIEAQVSAAFEAYGRSQRAVRRSVLEVSGGFDSTLAAAVLANRQGMQGVSVAFPYYEFRFEAEIQAATAAALGIARVEFDGTDLFPYAPAQRPAAFEEPSVFITAIRHSERVAAFAAEQGAERIYMGHGGDQCFATDLCQREMLVSNPPGRGPFSRDAWRVVSAAIETIRRSRWQDRGLGTFVYDARQDVWVKENFGVTIRTPFSDLAVFRAAQAWSRWCAGRGMRPDKRILADALPGRLPPAILQRRGKVAYDGVWMRAYRRHGDHISGVFERSAAVFDALGISTHWLLRRTRQLQRWEPASDREVLALYALAVWLQARGIERAAELRFA
ncbi:MAG: asparagine synthase-related protein [Burkholderiaceae bacterium]